MKANEDAKQATLKALNKWLAEYIDLIKTLMDAAEMADSEEELMEIKKRLILVHLTETPLGNDQSYFCHKMKDEGTFCVECPYGILHGKCTDFFVSSDYSKIIGALEKVIKAAEKYHCDKDDYELVAKLKDTKGNA